MPRIVQAGNVTHFAQPLSIALLTLAQLFALQGIVDAAEIPVAGQALWIRDYGVEPSRRIVARSRAAELGTPLADPRVVGARVEILGEGGDGGDSTVLDLPPHRWRGLGTPRGSRGYRFVDRDGPVRSVRLLHGARGTSVRIYAAGDDLPFAMSAPQDSVLVRFELGGDAVCMAFREPSLRRNDGRVLRARRSAVPASCSPRACGDGRTDPGEDCDDGNRVARDGCSPTCRSEIGDPCIGIEPASSATLGLSEVATGLSRPLWVVAPPGDVGRSFIVEQSGTVRIVDDGEVLPAPFLDLRSRVSCCGEQGLLSLVFHPRYAENRWFFVNYTDRTGATIVARWRVSNDPNLAEPDSERVLLRIRQDFSNHNGGQLAFGPDGMLYVGMGDGGAGGDPNERAQDPTSLLGKLLRLDVDVEGEPYVAVPADNPRAEEGLPLGLIWASGLRNPWRFSFDSATGGLYLSDVGQNAREEINVQPAASPGGENYGWDIFEGTACFEPPPPGPTCPDPTGTFVEPVHEYDHPTGCSITGGFVYRGCRMPDLHGTYFYSDFCNPFVRTFQLVEGVASNHRDRAPELVADGTALAGVTSFGLDAAGEIYVTTLGGSVYRIAPR